MAGRISRTAMCTKDRMHKIARPDLSRQAYRSAVEAWVMTQHSQEARIADSTHMQAINKRQEERHGHHSHKRPPLLQRMCIATNTNG